MSRHVDTDSTDQSIRVWAYDSDGAAITGEAYNSAGMAVSVVVRSAGRIVLTTSLTLVARSSVGVHRDSAFTEVAGGEYVVDLPDSYFTTAGREVTVTLTSTAISGGYVLAESLEVSAALATASTTGTGARTITITVNDGTTVLENARVRVTEGANTYTGLTNVSGVVTFNLDDATYTVAITKSGYSYAGTTLVVDGTETRTYSMTVISVTPPDDPALCAVTFHLYDQYGADMASQPVDITFVKWETTATDTPPVLSVPPVQTTNNDGVVSVNLFREATYKIVYGNAPYTRRVDVTIPDAGTYTVEI